MANAQTISNSRNNNRSICLGAEETATRYATWIKSQYQQRDVSAETIFLKGLTDGCKLDAKQFGIGSSLTYKVWENSGYEAELSRTRDRIIHASEFREIDKDLQEYKAWASKLDRNPRAIEKYISTHMDEYRRRGQVSQKNEKNKCQPEVDLRNSVLGPVRDQDSIGWCYAFSASELLTYKLGKKISAADLAMNHNDTWFKNLFKKAEWGEQDFEGGWMKEAIEATSEKGGACLESNLRSEDNGYSTLMSTLTEIDPRSADNFFDKILKINATKGLT